MDKASGRKTGRFFFIHTLNSVSRVDA